MELRQISGNMDARNWTALPQDRAQCCVEDAVEPKEKRRRKGRLPLFMFLKRFRESTFLFSPSEYIFCVVSFQLNIFNFISTGSKESVIFNSWKNDLK